LRFWRKPLDLEQITVTHGVLHIIADRCKGCGFCIQYCPRHVLEESEEFNDKGYHLPRVVDDSACLSCGFCELICPEFAIYRTEEEQKVVAL